MILIRGIKERKFAQKINKGILGCRDILSTVINPPKTGYSLSDYYEKNFVKALTNYFPDDMKDLNDPKVLYALLTDPVIPYIYVTYFHILNDKSLNWLDNFEDDYNFIAVDVKLDKITKTAIGTEYFGAPIKYIKDIKKIPQNTYYHFQAAIMCSLENLYSNKCDLVWPLNIYRTLAFPLLFREQDEKFTNEENEFRVIAYDSPMIYNGLILNQKSRKLIINSKSNSIKYEGTVIPNKNSILKSNLSVLRNPYYTLSNILTKENGLITLNSNFKEINISEISDNYIYLENKKDCSKFIEKTLKNPPNQSYVERTIRRTYSREDIPDAVFFPLPPKVNY